MALSKGACKGVNEVISHVTDDWSGRARHCGTVVGDTFYLMGGCSNRTKSTSSDHDKDEKYCSTDIGIFNFTTTKHLINIIFSNGNGVIPEAMIYSSCCTIGRDIYHFGGSCRPDSHYDNSLFKLIVDTLTWKCVLPSVDNCSSGPMKKHGSGIISFKVEGRDHLLVIGGVGESSVHHSFAHSHAEYIYSHQKPHLYYTNEIWSTSCAPPPPGFGNHEWVRHEMSGDAFPPRAFFSANTLLNNKGILFGGQVVIDGRFERCDDVFIVLCNKGKIKFQKVAKPLGSQWPPKRYHHASTIISSLTDRETQHLVVLGGCSEKIIADCWIMNIDTATWSKVDLPDYVTCRQKHSISSFSLFPNLVWMIVCGGYRRGSDPVFKPNNLCLVKLIFDPTTTQWSASKILNGTRIHSNDYHQFLFESLLEGREMVISGQAPISSATSVQEDVHSLVHHLQEAEQQINEVQKQKKSLEQELERVQRESEAERKKLLKQASDASKRRDMRIKELERDVKQLKESIAEKEKQRKLQLDMITKENEDKLLKKNSLVKSLEQQLSILQKESTATQQAALKQHQQEMEGKDKLMKNVEINLLSVSEELDGVKEFLKKLKQEKSTLEESVKQCESERETAVKELEKKEEEMSRKSKKVEILEQAIEKQKIESEKIIAENSYLHDKKIKEKMKIIEGKDTVLRREDLKAKELQKELQQTRKKLETSEQQVKDVEFKNKQFQKEIDELKAIAEKPQWMMDEEEVKVTEDTLGNGSFGEVKVAIFRGTKVAAKRLHKIIKSNYYSGVFTREMDICSKMHHPNIVQFIGATNGDTPVLLLELMETSLHKRMQECALAREDILHATIDILSALAYMHAWKPDPVIHRDISSPNVLMEPCGAPGAERWRSKLSDFGSANLQCHTKTEWPGNASYAAPEAKNPDHHTPSMDMYSLGILIMEMVIHRPPGMTQDDRKKQIDGIPWNIMKVVVVRCTSFEASSRPHAYELLEEARKFRVNTSTDVIH